MADKAKEQDGYDEAWEEGEDDASPKSGPDSGASAESATAAGGQTGDDGEDDAQDETGQQAGGDTGAESGAAEETAATGPSGEIAEDSKGAVDVDKELQRMRSWTGRLKKGPQTEKTAQDLAAIDERIAALEEMTKAKPARQAEDTGGSSGPGQKETAAEAKAIDAVLDGMSEEEQAFLKDTLGDDGDDFRKAIGLLIKSALPSLLKPLREEIDPLKAKLAPIEERLGREAEKAQEEAERAHFAPVIKAHPDYNDILESGDFDKWTEGLPAKEKLWAKYVDVRGSSAQIVDLISQYKADRGIGTTNPDKKPTPPAQDPKLSRKAQDAAAVRGRGSGPPPAKPGKDDYDAAWDEED